MDILKENSNSFTNDILSLLKAINLELPWIKKAEQFFDFSKDIDLSILEGERHFPIDNWKGFDKTEKIIDFLRQQNDYTYSDRYILFMDAINETEDMVYKYFDFEFSFDIDEKNPCYHAFSLVCENDYQTKAKLYANYVDHGSFYFGLLFYNEFDQLEIAEKDPRFIYETGKFRYTEKMFALALAFAETDKGCVFSPEEISDMTSTLLNSSKKFNMCDESEYEAYMSMLYMAKNYSIDIENFIRQNIKGRHEEFLTGIVSNVPEKYFKENIPYLFDLLKNYIDIDTMIKSTVLAVHKTHGFDFYIYGEPGNYGVFKPFDKNAPEMLAYEAVNFPDEYFAVMKSPERVSGVNASGFVPDCYYIFYDYMFDILERENPSAAKRLSPDRYNDMAEFFTQAEENAGGYIEEIGQYLRGEKDISVIIQKRDVIIAKHKPFTDYHIRCITKSLSHLPKYLDRYIAFKTIQEHSNISQYLSRLITRSRFDDEKPFVELKEFIDFLVREKIPLNDRFDLYQDAYNGLSYFESCEKQRFFDIYVEKMLSFLPELDEEYEHLSDIQNIYARKLYAVYLGKSDLSTGDHKKILLKMCGDSSKEVRKEIIDSVTMHKELESDIAELLNNKKQVYRETAVEILNNWGAENYKDILQKAADTEKSAKIADRISEILNISEKSQSKEEIFSVENYIKSMHKGGRVKKIQWLSPMPQVHKKDGSPADDSYMQAIILSYTVFSSPERSKDADRLANELVKEELEEFAYTVYIKWFSDGADIKRKQIMYFAAAYGGNKLIDEMLKCIKTWCDNSRGAIAAETAKAMALNGSSFALMSVNHMAHKFKHRQVKKAASEAMENAAKILGITAEELGDRIIPDLDFDSERKRIFDYGTRKFIVYLNSAQTLEVTDENGKILKTLPSPAKRDDETKATTAYEEYKQLKKLLKNVVSMQTIRLENALISGRKWNKTDWENLFVKNPVMHSFAESLVWAVYDNDKTVTFRYMEDGTFNNAYGDEYELPENCSIGLVHPIELDEETISLWKEQLDDYEIKQPFLQIERPVFYINDDEKGQLDLTRFKGHSMSALSLVGRTEKSGWYKGSVQDAGGFYDFYREDVTSREVLPNGSEKLSGFAAELSFSGCSVGYYEDNVTIENLRFYRPGTVEHGNYIYDKADDKKAIPLDEVDPRYFSEIIYQLEQITK